MFEKKESFITYSSEHLLFLWMEIKLMRINQIIERILFLVKANFDI